MIESHELKNRDQYVKKLISFQDTEPVKIITGIRRWEDLPREAQDYVNYLEKAVGCSIKYISVGPERDACIVRD